ncbi:MAG: hypothetical protein A3H98_03475 [Bacteroidetes bacterium RIFCSPLOWO2_02_FULL_36_8]|nr:MAG: hypothetical protein A3H98_03475 [Bacteroidetes bacterium RIFCSPLOWO2_02_FULL_36_8]OFY69502.1 MAG: hypothetical protein A3G23_10720 [Bacteroidetes bacterium RIFCSPLOWO2_12_FULL_37_12]
MHINRFITFFLILIFPYNISSVLADINDTLVREDTTRIYLWNEHARKNLGDNPALSIKYAHKALSYAQKLNYEKGINIAYQRLGVANYYLANFNETVKYFLLSLKLSEEKGSKSEIANCLNWLGNAYGELGNNLKAEEYYLRALKIYDGLESKEGLSECLGNLGIIMRAQGQYQKSLDFHLQELKIEEASHDKKNVAITLNNIGTVYYLQDSIPKAQSYYTLALKTFEEISYKEGIAITLTNLGDIQRHLALYDKAIDNFTKGLQISREVGLKTQIQTCYLGFSEVYAAENKYEMAYKYHQLYSQLKDSIFNEESSKQVHEMTTKYETEKKEQQIKLLNKDKEIQTKDLQRQKTIRNAVTGGLLLVLFFSFILVNRFLLIKKQKKVIEKEREKSEKLLLNILPKETANELKLNNSVKPKFYEQVTVMFTDFKGFTTIAEKMSAEELVSELDFIFKKFDEIISKYPIEKIKTIGDSYMCAGGVPVGNSTNPMDVVMAGLEIQEWMGGRAGEGEKGGKGESEKGGRGAKMNLKEEEPENKQRGECESESRLPFSPSPFPLFQVRIGIHTGPVIAGVVGDKKFAYDIWGDVVNTASRMESSGEVGKVNISGETYKLLVGAKDISPLRYTYRGKIPAKNKGVIEMYFVERKN